MNRRSRPIAAVGQPSQLLPSGYILRRVKLEVGEPSNKRKLGESSWNKFENETMHENGYTRREGKWQKVPEEFKPKYQEFERSNVLNLDCISNKEDILK